MILISFQSWILVFLAGLSDCGRGTGRTEGNGSRPGTAEKVSDAKDCSDWLSSSLEGRLTELPMSEGREMMDAEGSATAAAEIVAAALFAIRAAFFCWSSCVRDSTGSSRTMFSVAVGRSARTV